MPSSFNVTVAYQLSFPGQITCAAIPIEQPVLSVFAIANAANAVVRRIDASQPLTGQMTIQSLAPNTEYSVLCFTASPDQSSFSQSISPLQDTLFNRNLVITNDAPFPTLRVSFGSVSLVRNAFPTAITVSIPYKPLSNFSVTPIVNYYGPGLCNVNAQGISWDVPDSYSLAPQNLSFSDELVLSQILYLHTHEVGCYSMSFAISSDSVEAVDIVFSVKKKAIDSMKFFFFNSTMEPIQPDVTVLSAQFSSGGLMVLMTFSSDTDEGGSIRYRQNFNCRELLNFTMAGQALCRFASPSALKIFPSTTTNRTILPGDLITILPDKIKGRCLLSDSSKCAEQPFLSFPAIPVTLDSSIAVTAAVSAPSMIATGSNLTLDISLSNGNGGRHWTEISWTVLQDSQLTEAAQKIEQFLNSGKMLWTGCAIGSPTCDTVPFYFFFQPGEYSFRLRLRSFLGMSASASSVVRVRPQVFVPLVRLFAPTYSTAWANHSLTVRSSIDLDGFQCPRPLTISWLVYRGAEIDKTLIVDSRLYKDTRTFVVGSNTLLPFQEYRFRVVVFCGNFFGFDEIVKYVLPPVDVPFFSAGTSLTVPLSRPLSFDVSTAYALSGQVGVNFRWSCVQLQPLDPAGCRTFQSLLLRATNSSDSTIVLPQPQLVFNSSATYLISVTAVSSSLRTAFTASQLLSTTPGANAPTVTPFVVPQFSVNNTFGYQLDAVVTGAETFTAVWRIVTTNQTLSSRSFLNGGLQNFPIVIPATLLSSRLSYTFSLSAFLATDSCQSLSCADPATVSSSSFVVAVNQPPSNGLVGAYPPSGTENTIFSVFAYNWQDDNLPLFYAFYQSYYQSSGFNLIRNRMQIGYMTGKLSAPVPGSNNTVFVQAEVSDYFGATATASRIVTVEAHVVNATRILANTRTAVARILVELNPESILPVACEIVNAMHALNCTRANGTRYCDDLIAAGSYALERSVDFYNAGSALLNGLSKYTNSFSTANQATVYAAFRSLLALYQYLNNAILQIGLTRFTSAQLVQSMFETANEMVKMYDGAALALVGPDGQLVRPTISEVTAAGNVTEDVLVWLQRSVNLLSRNFFGVLPFSVRQSFLTNQHFDTSMTRSYWFDSAAQADLTVIEDVVFSKKLFPSNQTASYSYLRSLSLLPPPVPAQTPATSSVVPGLSPSLSPAGNPGWEKFENKFLLLSTNTILGLNDRLNFTLTLRGLNVSNPQFLRAVRERDATAEEAVPVVKRLYCNESAEVTAQPVHCSSAETNGPAYTFPAFDCGRFNRSVVAAFRCPLYGYQLVCSNYSAPLSLGSLVAHSEVSGETLVACSFPVRTGQAVAVAQKASTASVMGADGAVVSGVSGVSVSGLFSFSVETSSTSSAGVSLEVLDPTAAIKDPAVRKAVSIIAIVTLLAAAVVFAAFLVYRVKHFTDSTAPGRRYLPYTAARLVRPPVALARGGRGRGAAVLTDSESASTANSAVSLDLESLAEDGPADQQQQQQQLAVAEGEADLTVLM